MKRLLFLLLVFFSAFSGKSQIDYRIEKYLDDQNIDTFLVYTFECSGGLLLDSCQFDEPHYLIWKQNRNYYLKRFDYCEGYKVILLDTTNPLAYYLKNKIIINREKIKQPTYYEIEKVKEKIEKLEVISSISHSCYHKFRLSREPEYKYADAYDLNFREFENGRKNVNYNYNQNTKFKKLIDFTTTLLKEFESESRFETE